MSKIKCTSCNWICETEDMLSALSPFKAELIYACPKCREIEQVVGVGCKWGCDETWFDRTITVKPDGTEEGMTNRCRACGEHMK